MKRKDNKSEEPINYPAGNSSAHLKRCTTILILLDKKAFMIQLML